MLTPMTLVRLSSVLLVLATLMACEGEQRSVTPYGYYAPEVATAVERTPDDRDRRSAPLFPWAQVSEGKNDKSTIAGAYIEEPAGTPAVVHEGSWHTGINGVGRQFQRRVVTDQVLVGVHCTDSKCVALSEAGGVFVTTPFGDWQPVATPLPRLSRSFGNGQRVVACPSSGLAARASQDWGRSWSVLGYSCGQGGRRTVDFRSGPGWAIVGQRIRSGDPISGVFRMIDSPIPAPTTLTALDNQLVLFGPGSMAISSDAGESFTVLEPPPGLLEVRDAVLDSKGLLAVVGRARTGSSPIAVSLNEGRTWIQTPPLPVRESQFDHVVIDAERHIVVSAMSKESDAIYSGNMGRLWALVEARHPLRGALTLFGEGVLFGTSRGIAVPVGERGIYPMGLDQPLRDIVFADPMRAVGAGVNGGLYRTVDAGRTWYLAPGTEGLPITHVERSGSTLVAVGPGFYRWSETAGRRWFAAEAETSCEPTWMSTVGQSVLLGCAGGDLSVSDDHGRTWRSVETPLDFDQVLQIGHEGSWIALGADGSTYFVSTDGGANWVESNAWTSAPVARLAVSAAGIALLTENGDLGVLRPETQEIVWVEDEVTDRFLEIREMRVLDSGRLLILDGHGLWVVEPGGDGELRVPYSAGRSFELVGDGGIMVLGHTSTTHLTRVR